MIEVTELRKRYGGTRALDGMTFTVRPGQVTGFVGPNGAGKSTTMRIILGLDAADSGLALIGGQPYRTLRRPLTHVGSLLDAAALQPGRSARNHLLWLACSQGLPARRADEVAALTGLQAVIRRKAGGYSLGMRQRLGIAAALLGDPPALMLDEPFNGMDPEGIVWMRGFLRALAAEGRAVLVSSHLMSELETLLTEGGAGHLVVAGRGRVIADTSVADLLAAASGDRVRVATPAHAAAAAALTRAGAQVAATTSGLRGGKPFPRTGGGRPDRCPCPVQRGEPPPGGPRRRLPGPYPRRGGVQGGDALMTAPYRSGTVPYRSGVTPGRDGFALLLRAEWVKFRSVRGWVIAMIAAAAAIAVLGLAPGEHGSCGTDGPGSACTQPLGPGGEAVTDSFYFVHRSLAGDGSITARVTSLAGQVPSAGDGSMRAGLVPWAKAGIIVKAGTGQGSAYAAVMVTGDHGVRMQYDYTGDTPGLAGAVTAASPRWLRLTRAGDTVAGYDSADGTHWAKVGTAVLPGLPATVQGGLFAASPQYFQASAGVASVNGGLSQAAGVFDRLALAGGWTAGTWTGTAIGAPTGPASGPLQGFRESAGTFTVTGAGDIAPSVSGAAGLGVTVAQTLAGAFIGLIAMVVVAAMFMTAEYRRGLIRVTFAAAPRRGRVLAAKAVVVGAVAFAAGLAGAAVAVIAGQRELRASGVYVWPVTALTDVRVIAGTAAVLAVSAVIALAVGTAVRRGAAAVAAVIAVTVLPYLLIVAVPVLPAGAADWVARVTPAAAFAVQQTLVAYPQVVNLYVPSAGYWPLPPWAGFAVLCAWAAAALVLAAWLLHRRDT